MALLPSLRKLLGLVIVKEEHQLWVRGVMSSNQDAVVELSFESEPPPIPGTQINYIGIWDTKTHKCLFELQGNVILKKPTEELLQSFILPLIERVKGYRPLQVDNRSIMTGTFNRRDYTS